MENTMSNKKLFSQIGLRLFFGTLIIYAVQILSYAIVGSIPAIAVSGDLSFLVGMLPMYIIAFPIIFLLFKKIPVQITGEKKKIHPLHLIQAFIICYAGTYICNLIAVLLTAIIGALKQSEVENVMVNVTSSISLPVNLFVVVICAPIMEELLFRKTLIDRTAQFGEGIAVVFSGLVFGLFHGNLVQFGYAFLLGVFFGFIYIKTKNIVYPIILHMITNFFGSFLGSIIMDLSGLSALPTDATETEAVAMMLENLDGFAIYICYALFLITLVITGIVLFVKNKKKFLLLPGEITIEKGTRFKTMFLNAGMILYCIFWIVMIVMQLFA
ncbi:MAG: CPBP family intramembrane metalloprotease [Lachnospiraceae bacterium]|nr:CPBP family intramembrane metalloprotease [Lachnospiraceae bacterium]